jgi:hypothetical protein
MLHPAAIAPAGIDRASAPPRRHHASKTAGNDHAAPRDHPSQTQHAPDAPRTGAESAYSLITVRIRVPEPDTTLFDTTPMNALAV